jgi:rhodanese-related sulfurtransferase
MSTRYHKFLKPALIRGLIPALGMIALSTAPAFAQALPDVMKATLSQPNDKTPEVSTEELRRILADRSATVFDARPQAEFAISHIPGAVNVAPKAGMPMSAYVSDVAEIGRVLGDRKDAPIVLYCNGPFCGKSKRLAEELVAAGYTGVRRYQLGIPVWRALVGATQIEPEGIRHVRESDRTAVFFDARRPRSSRPVPWQGPAIFPRPTYRKRRMTDGFRWRTTTPVSWCSGRMQARRGKWRRRLPRTHSTTSASMRALSPT